MKKLIYKFVIFSGCVALLLVSYFSQPNAEINKVSNLATSSYAIPDTQFRIGAFDDGIYSQYNRIHDELGFNVWHHYVRLTQQGWDYNANDSYDKPIGDYQTIVTNRISANLNHDMRSYMDRPMVQYLVAGQRIDYQCENVPTSDPYWFWAYNKADTNYIKGIYDIIDMSNYGLYEDGSRAKVKYCNKNSYNTDSTFLIVDSLKANRELSFLETNDWLKDNAWKWYVMPRIRIDSGYAADPNHFYDPICRLLITGWRGETVIDINLKISNFKGSIDSIYHGNFVEKYYFSNFQDSLILDTATINNHFIPPSNVWIFNWDSICRMDIKIYWSGKCDAWFDRVRVENFPAHDYLTDKDSSIVSKINHEIDWAINSRIIPNYFYFEECQFSHFPAIKELNKQIMERTGNANGLIIYLNYSLFKAHMPDCWHREWSADTLKYYLHDKFGLRTVNFGSYPLSGDSSAYHPSTLSELGYLLDSGILTQKSTPEFYDNWLQNKLDMGDNNRILQAMDYISKNSNMNISFSPQTHIAYRSGHKLKEPSNEEIELQTDLALTYNAKGIMYFTYSSYGNVGSSDYQIGLTNTVNNQPEPRIRTVYGQNKYAKIGELSAKLKRWGPYIMSFDLQQTHSYIYRNSTERNNLLGSSYFSDVISYRRGYGNIPECNEDNPGGIPPLNLKYDCKNDRYLQVATFKNSQNDVDKYFMIINRRCSPDTVVGGDSTLTGKRFIRINFYQNITEFSRFSNWTITDLNNETSKITFNNTKSGFADLGWFMPGEGRLYKISPTVYEGGTLAGDESFMNESFTCNGIINNNEYNINIGRNCTITFDSSAGIIMNGGNFYCGEMNHTTTLQGKNNLNWKGISCSDCDEVIIRNTTISGVNPDITNNGILSFSDCDYVVLNNNTINSPYSTSNGVIIVNDLDVDESSEIAINGNTINVDAVFSYAIEISAEGAPQVPVYVQNNTITSNNNQSANGIFLTNVSLGVVTGNTINNFLHGVVLYSASADFANNNITSNGNFSSAIQAYSGSTANLSPSQSTSGLYENAGGNILNSYDDGSNNIFVNNSYFYLDKGRNFFNIQNQSAYHLSGFFPDTISNNSCAFNAAYNCFKFNGQEDTAWSNLTVGDGGPLAQFNFLDYNCTSQNYDGMDVIAISDDITDTVRTSSVGGGGASNEELKIKNEELKSISLIYSVHAMSIQRIYKQTRDSININMRKRNYDAAISGCTYILNTFPDSSFSIDALSKLYASSLRLDSAGSKISLLKTYFETLILNNADNSVLISRAYYFVQKCKVSLKQYTSALQGFQEIINQNPYSYEGLVASWDYAATQLLANGGGAFSGYQLSGNNYQLEEQNISQNSDVSPFTFDISQGIIDFLPFTFDVSKDINVMLDTLRNRKATINSYVNDAYDKSKFTKKDRQIISSNVEKTFKDKRIKQAEIVQELEKKSKSDNEVVKSKAKKELKTLKALGEVVKIKRPKDIKEHIRIINSDIKKVFGTEKSLGKNEKKVQLPTEYKLYQNYPNPFNPMTKINYDLPKDSKVILVIYDILGREMKRLVNNEFKQAGKYSIEFNGQFLASGVYFYRIIADSPGRTDKFIQVKKMVLIK